MSTRVVFVINVLFFQKEKIRFCSVDADTKISIPRFPNGLQNVSHKQSQCCGVKVKRNDRWSLKQN